MKELLYALPSSSPRPRPEWGLTPIHMAYRIIPGPRLAGVGLTDRVRDGGMFIACPEGMEAGDAAPFCRQVLAECRRRSFDRVLCDIEGPPTGGWTALIGTLAPLCARSGLALYLPEAFASLSPECRVLVSSAVMQGTLARRLNRAAERWGRERTVLAVEACAEDFLLPAPDQGTPLTPEELTDLRRRLEPAVFFDRGLCAHYFTYMESGGRAHFVLFDTPDSVVRKLSEARELSLPSALLAAPQVGDWLEEIFAP